MHNAIPSGSAAVADPPCADWPASVHVVRTDFEHGAEVVRGEDGASRFLIQLGTVAGIPRGGIGDGLVGEELRNQPDLYEFSLVN